MSRKDSTTPEPVAPQVETVDSVEQRARRARRNKILLVCLFVFCLLTFTITAEMGAVFARLFTGGPPPVAKLTMPSGKVSEVSLEEYRLAADLIGGRDASTEDVLAYATLRKLADAYDVVITDDDLRRSIELQMMIRRVQSYEQLWRGMGFGHQLQFEAWLRESMRANTMAGLLRNGAVTTTSGAIDAWLEAREELRLEFATWEGKEFLDAAKQETPSDEQLAAFYDTGLSFQQKNELEREAAVQYEALVVTSDMLATAAVTAWAGSEPPAEQALADFYERQKYALYMRPEPAEGAARPDDWTPVLTQAEVGEKLALDYRLYSAAEKLLAAVAAATDLAAFAAEKGVEHVPAGEFTPLSQLKDAPRLGSPNLTSIGYQEAGQWSRLPILVGDLAYLARVSARRERALPPLDEVAASVLDFWHQKRADELAKAAAEAFVKGLPRAEGAGESDPAVLDPAAFAAAVAAANRPVQVLEWIARRPRPAVDPKWGSEDRLRPYLRNEIGAKLDDYADGQVLGGLFLADPATHVVARVAGRRPVDRQTMWPAEIEQARNEGVTAANRRFQEEQISYAGLSRAFLIEQVLNEAPAE